MRMLHGKSDIMKSCRRCQAYAFGLKDILAKFAKDSTRLDGLDIYCRQCRNAAQKIRRRKGEEMANANP